MNYKTNLEKKCKYIRKDILNYISNAESGHPGSALSIVEILVTLYYNEMQINPKNPKSISRDRFILSKGHGDMALYCVLADLGFYNKKELTTYRQLNSKFQGHPDICTPGVDVSTGSLGQGLSIGCGMALRAKIDSLNYRTYVLMGDGELNEGQIWEAAMFASAHNLTNLIGIIDHNKLQHDGTCKEILPMGNLTTKWHSFGWETYSCDGHDIQQIKSSLNYIRKSSSKKPKILIAHTIKGKGVPEYENNIQSHSTHGPIDKKILKKLSRKGEY